MNGIESHYDYRTGRMPPPAPPKPKRENKHWSAYIYENVISTYPDSDTLDVTIKGGADDGQFCYINSINYETVWHRSGRLELQDIVLEVQGQKLAGYTLRDATNWMKQISQNAAPVMIKTIRSGMLPLDLHTYLNTRFQKGSYDHDLQQVIRTNLYLRTVPCTTRAARPGEMNGVDYTFLSLDEFRQLERDGSLLESGLFDGNYYGTPKPPAEPSGNLAHRSNSAGDLSPSSQARHRPADSSLDTSPSATTTSPPPRDRADFAPTSRLITRSQSSSNVVSSRDTPSGLRADTPRSPDDAAPLPDNWEMSFAADGTKYFINHDTETTDWLDPRLVAGRKRLVDCADNELPYGWEIVNDPHYGTYYIDHINKCTQYENPVLKSKRELNDEMGMERRARRSSFTKDPQELKGKLLTTRLVKSIRGFGFTIVGGNVRDEEFLQIKNIVPNGPCFCDGTLASGDVLVRVDDECVLGYTHQDVIAMFQSIKAGTEVRLQVCRGYRLLYDIDDPNTEVRTAVAVAMPPPGSTPVDPFALHQRLNASQRSIKSLPDLARTGGGMNGPATAESRLRPNNAASQAAISDQPDLVNSFHRDDEPKGEIIEAFVERGTQGFGFTIADCSAGQKVKKIVNRERCAELEENDLLIEVDGVGVANMSHTNVANLLMSCPTGVPTKMVIQRGGILPHRTKKSSKTGEDGSLQGDSSFSSVPGVFSDNSASTNDDRRRPELSPPRQPSKFAISRPKTPTSTMDTRIRTPAPMEGRCKTPTSLAGMTISEPYGVRPFRSSLSSSRTNEGDMQSLNSFRTDFVDVAAPSGARDHHPAGQKQRINDSRQDAALESNGDYMRTDHARPGQFRSRTPGPELMSSSRGVDYGAGGHSYERGDMRSKTPLPYGTQNRNYTGHGIDNHSALNNYENHRGDGDYGNHGNQSSHYRVFPPRFNDHAPYSQNVPPRVPQYNTHKPIQFTNNPPQHFTNSHPSQFSNLPPLPSSNKPNFHNISYSSNPPFTSHQQQRPPQHPENAYQIEPVTYMPMERTYSNQSQFKSQPHQNYNAHSNAINSSYHNLSNNSYHSQPSYGATHNQNGPLPPMPPPHLQNHASQPIKQSTSFENVDPAPTSVTQSHGHHLDDHSPHSGSYLSDQDEPQFVEMDIFLERTETGFGFRIIGGTEEGSQVSVGYIVPGGAADMDGQLRAGDEITHVDNLCVINSSHADVVNIIGNASKTNHVLLTIRRHIQTADSGYKTNSDSDGFPYDVTLTRHDDEGFGFTIVTNSAKTGTTIGQIVARSPADRSDRLRVGDRLLAVNAVSISNLHHDHIVNLIKESPLDLTLTIGAPLDDNSSNASTSQQGSQGSLANSYPGGEQSWAGSDHHPHPRYHQSNRPSNEAGLPPIPGDPRKDPIRMGALLNQVAPPHSAQVAVPHPQLVYNVLIQRGQRGFGFSIRGGREFNNMPLFVLRIAEGSGAHLHSSLRVGDQILEINGRSTEHMTHADAIALIQSGGNTVHLVVKRTGRPPPQIESNLGPNPIRAQSNPSVSAMNGPIGHSSPQVARRTFNRDDYYGSYPHEQQTTQLPRQPATMRHY